MWPSLKPSQRVAVVGAIDPQSVEAAESTVWIDASQYENYLAIVQAGAIGANGTVDAAFFQAQDAQGTGAKAIDGAAIATVTQAGPNQSSTQSEINLNVDALDVNNGFRFVRLTVTAGVAASEVAALVLGFDQHQGFASDTDAASVLQIVG